MWELWAWDDTNPGQLTTLASGISSRESALLSAGDFLMLFDEIIIISPLGNVETVYREVAV